MGFRDKLNSKLTDGLGPAKTFVHTPISFAPPIREDREGGRVYVTPEGNVYPSATTILGAVGDKTWLEEWRNRIGHEEAHRITSQSARRGTELHAIVERYIGNDPNYLGNPTPIYYDLFRQVKPRIDQSLGNVYGIEIGLYSDYLKASGTSDLIAEWDGVLSVVDWKNARYFKKLEDIEGYFVQTDMYAVMFEERTRKPVPQLVIVMAVEGNAGEALVFKQKRKDWDKKMLSSVEEYYAKAA